MPTTMEALRFLLVATIAILIASPPLSITHSAPDATNNTYFLPASNTNKSLFQYKLFRHPQSDFSYATFNDTNSSFGSNKYCNDPNILLETLKTDLGIYGRSTSIISAHDWIERYTVYFQVYFVTSLDDVCGREDPKDKHYYLSVVAMNWYGKVRDPNRGQVIWTANPGNPVDTNACLYLTDSGNLILNDANGNATWEVQVTTSAKRSLFFTYEGNLVLYENDSSTTTDEPRILWQSYDSPTDTLMVLQGLKNGMTLCTSNDLNYNKSSVFFSMDVVNGIIRLYASDSNRCRETSSEKGNVYWSYNMSHISDAQDTSLVVCWPDPENATLIRLMASPDPSALNDSLTSTQIDAEACGAAAGTMALPDGFQEPWSTKNDSNITDITYATFVRLDPDGDLSVYMVNDTRYPDSTATWSNVYSVFGSRKCDLTLYCGFYGVCDSANNRCMKECANRFHQVGVTNQTNQTWMLNESSNKRSGCTLNKTIGVELPNCSRNNIMTEAAVRMGGVRYYFLNHSFDVRNSSGENHSVCWAACSGNCSCTSEEMAGKWEEARRMVEVAMLCVQREQEKRPSMSSVVQMLEGNAEIPQLMVDHELGLFPSFLLRMTRENSLGSEEMDSLLLHSSFLRSDDDEAAAAAGGTSYSVASGSSSGRWRYVRRPIRMSPLNIGSTSTPAVGRHHHHL